jgi:hypothetical protein
MSRIRTAVALLFHVLLLHASVLGGGMACAPVWTGMVAAAPEADAALGAHASHGAPAHAEHVAHPRQADAEPAGADDTRTPLSDGAPTHCATASGCAVAALAAPSSTDDALRVVRSVAEVGRVSLPPSIRPAPETPPPRA